MGAGIFGFFCGAVFGTVFGFVLAIVFALSDDNHKDDK